MWNIYTTALLIHTQTHSNVYVSKWGRRYLMKVQAFRHTLFSFFQLFSKPLFMTNERLLLLTKKSDFILLDSKITADGDCSYEIKRRLLLGRKVMTNWLWFFLWSHMDVRVGLWRKMSTEELMLLNCGVGEDSWESLGWQGDPTSPF